MYAKISGLNTMLTSSEWQAGDLRPAVEVAVEASAPTGSLCGSDWPVSLLNGGYEKVWRETVRVLEDVAPDDARAAALGDGRAPVRPRPGRAASPAMTDVPALTDQAIAKIKDLIMSGEFAAGSKLPKEQDLAQRLGLSRNSLREAVRALTLIGVLEPRVGDGTYVTSLEPELLLTGMGFISDLLTGSTLLELHQVRRILEPVATEMAATRLDAEGTRRARALPRARWTPPTRRRPSSRPTRSSTGSSSTASGNTTLASLIQNLSGGTLRARLWRSVTEQDAIEMTKRRHWDIYDALRDGDGERARAADLIHLSEGEQWLRELIENEQALGALGGAQPEGELAD